MKIAFLHISDIHLRGEVTEWIISRTKNIASATQSVSQSIDKLIILITGDLVFSGKEDQFNLAKKFINSLYRNCRQYYDLVHLYFIPGNHDLEIVDKDSRASLLNQ